MTEQVLVLNRNGAIVFNGKTNLTEIERDRETGCLIANCVVPNSDKTKILVWKIDNKWQGWL